MGKDTKIPTGYDISMKLWDSKTSKEQSSLCRNRQTQIRDRNSSLQRNSSRYSNIHSTGKRLLRREEKS